MRLIDADVLLDKLYETEFSMLCPLDEVSGVIDDCPTVDAGPVKHGWWIDTDPSYKDCYSTSAHVCSCCHDFYTLDWKYMKYCPNCGAKIKGAK